MEFEKEYFVGKKISNYGDYRKKKFDALAEDLALVITHYAGAQPKIRDFGCGTGALLAQLKKRGFEKLKGTDISHWAIDYGKKNYNLENELEYYNRNMLAEEGIDVVLFLDVLEHMPYYEMGFLFEIMQKSKPEYLIVRVPVSLYEGEDYALDVSKNDKTHIQVHDKNWWVHVFDNYGYMFAPNAQLALDSIYDSPGVLAAVFERMEP